MYFKQGAFLGGTAFYFLILMTQVFAFYLLYTVNVCFMLLALCSLSLPLRHIIYTYTGREGRKRTEKWGGGEKL